ncbi:succinate--hydroxymethylglutarate CoA-transferase [Malassezia psittaci]|uniref:Kinesin-like protein n=1 Tax=Malassezia psittaci TaxID=1821823 RepID=A0AAF0JL72_9BASI|nr:succinate--hydroxymethylglutarate CoA-transferase [Malassezia psittaci]
MSSAFAQKEQRDKMAIGANSRSNGSPEKRTRPETPLKKPLQGVVGGRVPMSAMRTPSSSSVARYAELGVPTEPIRTYLRIRPPVDGQPSAFDLKAVSNTEVVVSPYQNSDLKLSGSRIRTQNHPPAKYTFSRVFSENQIANESQSDFFQETTLPHVSSLLSGNNSLIFTYGMTNSGKTYTIQGIKAPGQAGILPRTIDVIFNSIEGLSCTKAIRPMGLSGVQPGISDPVKSLLRDCKTRQHSNVFDTDTTQRVSVSDAFRYSVWVSYVEVYNEKLYDLLDTPPSSSLVRDPRNNLDPSTSRRPLLLKSEVESGGKFVSGLKEVKVQSIAEAKGLIQRGQENRSVFGTMANQSSSRSHGVFTIKILREHTQIDVDEKDIAGLSRKYFVSRMSIVDLAGSERVANTDVPTGPRLKEAGNINKSLMCLGQCLEIMRKNQIRAGHMNPIERVETTNPSAKPRRRQSIVPFRHSKLTELFQSFFTGDGAVIMIVNMNPHGAGFEESLNVLRFSAMAKEVVIQTSSDGSLSSSTNSKASQHVTSPTNQESMSLDEIEDDEEEDDDPFVTMIMQENERLKQRCERAENLCMVIEKTVRDEMAVHLETSLRKMHQHYERQLQAEMDENDAYVDRKIDLFAKISSKKHASPIKPSRKQCEEAREELDGRHSDNAVTDSFALAPRNANILDTSQDFYQTSEPIPIKTRKLRSKPAWNIDDIDAHLIDNFENRDWLTSSS